MNVPGIDRRIATLSVVSTLVILVARYLPPTDGLPIDNLALYFFVPLAVTVLAFRDSPAEYGLRLGHWREGLAWTLGSIAIVTPILFALARAEPSIREFYRVEPTDRLVLDVGVEMIGWEFLFRGWLLFGYGRRFGANALWLQAVPFALAHIGKPPLEAYSTIFGGFYFGLVAWRTRSFAYPFLIHWYIAVFTPLAAAGRFG